MERLERGLEQERRLTAQLEKLMSLTLLPRGDISEEAMAQLLLERIVSALGADGGFAVLENADRFKVVASFHTPADMAAVAESRPASSFSFWQRLLTDPGGGAYRERTAGSLSTQPDRQPMVDRGVTSHAVFPVREGDRLLGAFFCYFSSPNEATDADDRNVEAVGRIISIAYSNVRMREGLAEAAEHERRLTAELRALQELTLLGASTDDLGRLAQETIEAVVVATGASGGGYILVDPSSARVDPITWVGDPSLSWAAFSESPRVPGDWPPFSELQTDQGIYLSQPDDSDQDAGTARAQAVLPLRVDDRLAGVLHLEWADRPLGQQFDVHFLEPIARICSISLANFRLRAELLHRAAAQRALGHRLDALDELTRIGEEASSFEELAHRTVSLVREALDAGGVCYLLIEVGRHFETHAVAGETGAFRLWLKGVPAKDAPGGSLLLSGASSVLGDFVAGQVDERVLPLAAASGFRSFGAIPIHAGEELAGALLCFFEQPVASLPLDEAALDSVARITAIALANFRLRERLVSSEERYRTLFEESPDALLVSALDGTVLDANEAAVRLYHLRRDEVLGRYFGQFITADEREMARRRQVVWAQGRGTFQDCGRRPDGSEFPVEIEVRVVDLGGQRRFLHLIHDLSDQDRLQRELLQAQKMEALGQLVSGVAHELNNPLAAIIAFSQLMRSDERLPEDMRHDAGLLVQEADRTRRIVQNLLDFARARPPERRPTSIGALVQSVLELQSYALNANQIQVKVDIPATLPEVDLDRAQLQQVLLNLTINAIQAHKTTDRKAPAQLWISAAVVKTRPTAGAVKGERPADEPQLVRITIRDDGPGVPESARARLFDPFFTTKQPGEGTGLGLSVSFGIVAAHNGHLWYEPGPRGVGSSFVIELPTTAHNLEIGQPQAKQAAAAIPGAGTGPGAAPRRGLPGAPAGTTRAASESAANSGLATPATAKAAGRATAAARATAKATITAVAKVAAKATGKKKATETTVDEPARPASTDTPVAPPTTESGDVARPADPQPDPSPRRPLILALDDEPSIRSFLRKALVVAGMDCVPFPDGAQALDGVRESDFDVMLIDHRMAGMSGTEFYEAAIEVRPELARRAVFMSGDVLNPDLRGFATQRDIRLLAKPFDIEAVIQVVREVLAAAER
jgi:PAS domain S-box-containing protein